MGVECKPALCGGRKLLFGGCQYMPRNPHGPFIRPNARPWWQGSRCFLGYIQTNGNKVAVNSFKNLRAMVAPRTPVDAISAESFQKHATI
jgi:hypothetical protein